MINPRGKDPNSPVHDLPRVLFVSDHLGYTDGVIHGATTYFLHTLPALKEAGVPLTVCFLRERHPAAEILEAVGITPVFLQRGKWDLRAFHDLKNIIHSNHIELVHAAGMKGTLLGRRAATQAGLPHFIHLHDANPVSGPIRFLQRMDAPLTGCCLCISRAVEDFARREFKIPEGRTSVLYNPLPAAMYQAPSSDVVARLRAEQQLSPETRVVVLVGRLSPEKGHAAFLRALPAWLKEAGSNVRVWIAGEGPERRACEHLIREEHLSPHVTLLGHRKDVPALLSLASVMVMPSIQEGFGYAALEAMALGCPVVAFGVGGLPELLDHDQTGRLAPPGHMDALLGHMTALLNDPALATRLATGARARARDFSMEQHVQRLLQLYRGAVRT